MTRDPNVPAESSSPVDHTPLRAEPVVIPSPDKHEESHHKTVDVKRSGGKKVKGRVMKIIRRTHLYTGLLLLPWVLLFGSSGFMFNHGDLFVSSPPEVEVALTQAQTSQSLGFAAVDPSVVAQQIVASLNQPGDENTGSFELVDPGDAHLRGQLSFEGRGPNQKHQFRLNLQSGQAAVTTIQDEQKDEPERSTPSFAGRRVSVDALPVDDLKEKVAAAAQAVGVESQTGWSAGRGGPQVRFQLRDEQGRIWNVTYNVMNGELAGRAIDEPVVTNISTIMTAMHKQHHYPTEVTGKTIWLIFGDMTALTMVFWGISGLIMWWQLKPTRVVGTAGLLIMIVVAFFVFSGAIEEMYYGPPRTRSAPPARAVVRPAVNTTANTTANTDTPRSARPARSIEESSQAVTGNASEGERQTRRRRQRPAEESEEPADEAE